MLQKDVTEESLLGALVELLRDGSRRAEMSVRAKALAKPGAVEKIAGMVVGLANKAG